jgi:hypothetical protein
MGTSPCMSDPPSAGTDRVRTGVSAPTTGSCRAPDPWIGAAAFVVGPRELTEGIVACHEHGTALRGLLPASWDHLGCQSWDHPARLVGLCSLTARVMSVNAEVVSGGVQEVGVVEGE